MIDRYIDAEALDDCEGACLEILDRLDTVTRALTMRELAKLLKQRSDAACSDAEAPR